MSARIITGDVRDVLPTLAAESVQCVITSPPYFALRSYLPGDHPDKGREIGTEQTPDAYVAALVAVFREVRRVLRNDGVVFLNVGDSYASHDAGGYRAGEFLNPGGRPPAKQGTARNRAGTYSPGLKPKDLIGIPWRLAFALQVDGWYLRSDIIWAKPNPMPESVTDRPTKSHEYLFLLTKSARYSYDAAAIAEPSMQPIGEPFTVAQHKAPLLGHTSNTTTLGTNQGAMTRNKRSVWTIATQPFAPAHFAVMPEALVEPCILAGTSERGECPACGAPWRRVVDVNRTPTLPGTTSKYGGLESDVRSRGPGNVAFGLATRTVANVTTLGWEPTCHCDAGEAVPQTVLDPFSGSGTVGVVALRHGRAFVGVELNAEYARMSERRIFGAAPLFNRVVMERHDADADALLERRRSS